MVTLIHFKEDKAYRVLAYDGYVNHEQVMDMLKDEPSLRVDDNRVMLTYQDSL